MLQSPVRVGINVYKQQLLLSPFAQLLCYFQYWELVYCHGKFILGLPMKKLI